MMQMRFPPEIDLGWFWHFEGVEKGQRQPSRASQQMAARLLPEALSLANPVAYYQLFPVSKVQKKRLVLNNGVTLNGGFVGHMLAGASEIAVVIATIGAQLEGRSSQYFADGFPARGYLLDGMGTVALGFLAERVRRDIEASAVERGLQASTPISPGHGDWKMTEQEVLFGLLPSSETEVALTQNYLMAPRKSLSLVIGLGERMITHAESTQCQYCSLQKTCTYRRLPGDEWDPGIHPLEEVPMEND